MKRWASIIITLVAVLAVLAGCAKEPKHVKIGYLPTPADILFFVAIKEGCFKKQALEVTPVKFGTANEAMNALVRGEVDLLAHIGFTTIFALEQKTPGLLRIFLPAGEGEGHVVSQIIVRKDAGIESVDDLKGRKIGCSHGITNLKWLGLMLKKMGFDPQKDVTIVQVDRPMLIQGLARHEYDALYAMEPRTTRAIEQGIGISLLDNPRSKYIMDPFLSGSLVMPAKLVKEEPEKAKRIYVAFERAARFLRKNPDKAKELLPKYTGLSYTLLERIHVQAIYEPTDEIIDLIQKEGDLLHEFGLLLGKVDVKPMILTRKHLR